MSTNNWYWLVPGSETIHGSTQVTLQLSGGVTGSGNTTNDLITSYEVGGSQGTGAVGTRRNCPRSMAIAYNSIQVTGIEIHLTELAYTGNLTFPPGANINVVLEGGWSQEVNIRVYGFCDVNPLGIPMDSGTGQPILADGLTNRPWLEETNLSGIGPGTCVTRLGGLCINKSFKQKRSVGHAAWTGGSLYLAVAVQVQGDPLDVLGSAGGGNAKGQIISRTISVTVHGEEKEATNMKLTY
tara:strand:+ start:4427 stop:5146 length:720 start_codon:yes stop_codon:yes gene_type:complete